MPLPLEHAPPSGTQTINLTVLPPSPQQLQTGQSHWHPSAGYLVGVSIFIVFVICIVSRCAYVALLYELLRRMKERLRLCPTARNRSPLPQHGPVERSQAEAVDIRVSGSVAQAQAAVQMERSRDTLPLYQPARDFSSDVLQGVGGLEVPGSRSPHPPSYRSRLSLGGASLRD